MATWTEQQKKDLYKRTFIYIIKHKRINGVELRFAPDYGEILSYWKFIKVHEKYGMKLGSNELTNEAIAFEDWLVKEQKFFSDRTYSQKLTHTRRSHTWRYRYLTRRGQEQAVKLGLAAEIIEKKWNEAKGEYQIVLKPWDKK